MSRSRWMMLKYMGKTYRGSIINNKIYKGRCIRKGYVEIVDETGTIFTYSSAYFKPAQPVEDPNMDGRVARFVNCLAKALAVSVPDIVTVERKENGSIIPDGKIKREDGDLLLVLNTSDFSEETAFVICREMRYLWQQEYHPEWAQISEDTVGDSGLSVPQLDALAFTAVAMSTLVRKKPSFNDLPDETAKAIFSEANKISKECRFF